MSNKNKYLVCALTLCAIGAVSAGLIALLKMKIKWLKKH